MFIRTASRLIAGGLFAVLSSSICLAGLPGEVRFQTYTDPDGKSYFALSVMPKIETEAGPRHVVILFDTSASQVGPFREKAMAALDSLLAQLNVEDQIDLMAVDLESILLTPEPVAPGSLALKEVLVALKKREPLGTTDMPMGLRAAAMQFREPETMPRSMIYIGDGISAANLLDSNDFTELTKELVQNRISISSYAIGPNLDTQLLASLAMQTGGVLAIDGSAVSTADIGRFLASSMHETVIWPTRVELPDGFAETYPLPFPPLRTDRDSVVIGAGKLDRACSLKIEAQSKTSTLKFNWTIEPRPSDQLNSYLARLVLLARKDQGVSLPILGMRSLIELRRLAYLRADDLNRLGRQAIALGQLDQARQLAQRSQAITPFNPDARAITAAVAKMSASDGGSQQLKPDNEVQAPADERAGALLSDFERRQRILAGALEAEVRRALSATNRQMKEDPAAAIESLKLLLEQVRFAAEVNAEVREQLEDQIELGLQRAARQSVIHEDAVIRQQEIQAAADERRRLNEQLYMRDERVDQLIARFDALMDEARYGDASQVAGAAFDIAPTVPTATAAVQSGQMAGYATRAAELRLRRQFGFVDTLATVEEAQIPTPDEPPIYYPPPETWELLTKRRKQFAAVDLKSLKPAEKRIVEELDKPTSIDFVETPLSEVVQYLEDLHKIQIELDSKALEDASIQSDIPITRNLQGVSLRSALRLMLGELDLTYVIRNEVLEITTVDAAQEQMSTRVYPVADLVVPISSMMMGRGGMGMGMGMGGMGMGGMGMGMGGMGMGGMGMGGMGMGMGGMRGGMGMGGMGGGFF